MAAAVAFGFTATSCSDDPDHPDKNVLETPMMQAPQLTSNSATLSWKKMRQRQHVCIHGEQRS